MRSRRPIVAQVIIDAVDALRGLRGYPFHEVWGCIEKLRGQGGPTVPESPDNLRDAEWQLLSRPTTERQDADFRAVPTDSPRGYDSLIDQVVLVSRLREVRALLGFTRLSAPERDELRPVRRIPLARGPAEWVPAVEQRGEGIFLELREQHVARWASSVAEHEHITALGRAYRQWALDRDQTPSAGFPIARFLLIHTLSHMLMRQVALECGYSSASLRERIYLGTPSSPAAGVLISTAASDSEGTLGGLVALGERRYLERILRQALDGRFPLLVGPAVRGARTGVPVGGAAQRGLPRLPVRVGDQLRGRQPLAGPRGARRPDRRRRLRVPGAVSGPDSGSAVDSHDGVADWACRIAERLPPADVRRLAEAAAGGEPGVRQLRAGTGSVILRDACDQLRHRLSYAEPAYVEGLLIGAVRAVERARRHQSVSVVWTGPESGVSSSRLTAATVIELINAAQSEILLVSYATHTEPSINTALAAALARGVLVTLLAERHQDNPSYTASGMPFPGLGALRLHWPAAARPPGASLHAKVIVVDDKVALVGSANLTNRAMESNLECGILIRGGPQPRAIRDHITSLYAAGRLLRL